MSINSNIGVTSITLGDSDQQPPGTVFINNSRKYTKLCATFYNPQDQRNNYQDPDIISFPSDFFTLIKYDLVVRTMAPVPTEEGALEPAFINRARVSSGGFIVDGTQNAISVPNLITNTLENLTIGDIELPNVLSTSATGGPVESEPTQILVTISYSNNRYTLSLKNLQVKEKASIFLELF